MPTLVLDPPPVELRRLIDVRRRTGADRWDEVWEGVLHMNPPPSFADQQLHADLIELLGPLARAAGLRVTGEIAIGELGDHRVPDLALSRPGWAEQWQPTAALVVEIVSPGDESWDKLTSYAAHRVDEVVIVDPTRRGVNWLALSGDGYQPADASRLVDLGAKGLADRIDWPD